jgi:ferredoxin
VATPRLRHPGPFEPYDERDTVFARVALEPGTAHYRDYYRRRPELERGDGVLRNLRGLATPGTMRYRPGEAALVDGIFATSELVARALDASPAFSGAEGTGAARHDLADGDPAALTRLVRDAAFFLGADDVGIAPLEPGFVYTHRGRRRFGEEVELDHTHAVILVQAMRHEYVLTAPEMTSTCETARVYQGLAAACHALAAALDRLGIAARAHVDSNYVVICPPLAESAGLGEVGRNGVLVHRTHGPGVRLGVVTVGADLVADAPRSWGVAEFCRVCGKCADNCPAGAISRDDPVVVRGALKWPMDPQRCYKYWRTLGTDCGLCLRTCPFAKPDTALHRLVRGVVRATAALDRPMLWADDLLYGRRPRVVAPPRLEVGPPRGGSWRNRPQGGAPSG